MISRNQKYIHSKINPFIFERDYLIRHLVGSGKCFCHVLMFLLVDKSITRIHYYKILTEKSNGKFRKMFFIKSVVEM